MRITSGQFRGTNLITPEDDSIRPTSDKARQGIFNSILSGKYNFSLRGASVLDGTCGTGAMGIEALSRGAKFCHFVDQSQDSIALTRRNIDKINIDKSRYQISTANVASLQSDTAFDLVCLDPPYGQNLLPDMIAHILTLSGITDNTLFIIEEDVRTHITVPLKVLDRKTYVAAQILYAKMPV